jgi:hypothetical protein
MITVGVLGIAVGGSWIGACVAGMAPGLHALRNNISSRPVFTKGLKVFLKEAMESRIFFLFIHDPYYFQSTVSAQHNTIRNQNSSDIM